MKKKRQLTDRLAGMTPTTQIITDGADCYPWHEVYAWLPVKTIGGDYVWRQKVYKRKVWIVWGTGFHMEPETQYATLMEFLKYDHNNS